MPGRPAGGWEDDDESQPPALLQTIIATGRRSPESDSETLYEPPRAEYHWPRVNER